jgi:leucine dehydrogenase
VCGEDVGTTPEDLAIIRRATPYVAGLPDESGDTSPLTGYGVFQGIRAAARYHLKRDDLEGLKIAIQGAGNVGQQLAQHLTEVGGRVFVADVDEKAVQRAVESFGAEEAGTHEILFLDVDVLAPCALGGVLDDETIPRIQAKVVCGGANNQLADDRHGVALADRGILYVPDYVANAGGLIAGVCEWAGAGPEEAKRRVEEIYQTCDRVFARAEREGLAPSVAAERLARELIEAQASKADQGKRSDASTLRGKGSV